MQYYNHLTSIFSHCVTPWFTEWLNQLIYLQGLLMVCFSHTAITISSSCQHISRLHSHSTFTRVQHQRPPAVDFPLASTHTREAPPTQHTIPAHMDSFHPRSDTRLHLLGTLSHLHKQFPPTQWHKAPPTQHINPAHMDSSHPHDDIYWRFDCE